MVEANYSCLPKSAHMRTASYFWNSFKRMVVIKLILVWQTNGNKTSTTFLVLVFSLPWSVFLSPHLECRPDLFKTYHNVYLKTPNANIDWNNWNGETIYFWFSFVLIYCFWNSLIFQNKEKKRMIFSFELMAGNRFFTFLWLIHPSWISSICVKNYPLALMGSASLMLMILNLFLLASLAHHLPDDQPFSGHSVLVEQKTKTKEYHKIN